MQGVASQAVNMCHADLRKRQGQKITAELLDELYEHWHELVENSDLESDDDE